jgi:hypothetical protein
MESIVYFETKQAAERSLSRSVIISLLMRTGLFVVFGMLFVGMLALAGSDQPLKEAEKWWPFQAILANIATFVILRYMIHKDGGTFRSMFAIQRERLGKDLRQFLWLMIVGFALAGIPLSLFSYLLLGSVIPPELMFQPLPVWAAVIALIVFPISNGLVETPTYMGYALPRLRATSGKLWLAIIVTGLALAFQHVALPLVFDVPYMLWRFVGFIPLAIALGYIFSRTKRLFPIALAHYVMDLQMAVQVFLNSIE